jgi:hypothetical protein
LGAKLIRSPIFQIVCRRTGVRVGILDDSGWRVASRVAGEFDPGVAGKPDASLRRVDRGWRRIFNPIGIANA